ncbi:hypothetical protein [Symbiopectobacterium sp.]|uniref:hypothetical protein n=1 Tax=Symbiopectobacterium sp. TaxID=2952789 RepID=UPI003F688131
MEMTGCFNNADGKLTVPGDILTSMLTTAQKLALLDEQIDIIQRKAEWLKLHRFLLV